MEGANDDVRQPRKGLARLCRADRAGEDAHADQEHVFQTEHPHAFEQVLVVAGLRDRCREPSLQLLPIRQRAEEARIDQCVHDLRIARQSVGEAGRGADDHRQQGE